MKSCLISKVSEIRQKKRIKTSVCSAILNESRLKTGRVGARMPLVVLLAPLDFPLLFWYIPVLHTKEPRKMPLLFQSLSHGEVPFGFFNIETDMILLNNYFFFASDMSYNVIKLAGNESGMSQEQTWPVYILTDGQIGNLMGAISGVVFKGFIGEVYTHFPFPHEPEKFKQNPEGYKTRELIEEIVKRYTSLSTITIEIDTDAQSLRIGEYRFNKPGFHALLGYLWAGGYPRWKDTVRPSYILKMREAVEHSPSPLFHNIAVFD